MGNSTKPYDRISRHERLNKNVTCFSCHCLTVMRGDENGKPYQECVSPNCDVEKMYRCSQHRGCWEVHDVPSVTIRHIRRL